METIQIALGEIGVHSSPGIANTPRVLQYFADIGQSWVHDDDTAWCSAFANWVAKKAGFLTSNSLAARSWLKIGKEVAFPTMGDICVFWRISPQSSYGHVAFFIKEDIQEVWVLGGNQGSAGEVSIECIPKSKLLSYRSIKP